MLQLVLPFSVLPIRLFSVLSSFAISSSRKRAGCFTLHVLFLSYICGFVGQCFLTSHSLVVTVSPVVPGCDIF